MSNNHQHPSNEDDKTSINKKKSRIKYSFSKIGGSGNSNKTNSTIAALTAAAAATVAASSSGDSSGGDDDESYDGSPSAVNSTSRMKKSKKRIIWEVIEGYRDANLKISRPPNYEGILLKRRNWPMKGWHKRYFILADGILSYSKSKTDLINKNKVHGTLNAYVSIVSFNSAARRILIDSSSYSNAFICHLKARDQAEFDLWLECLKQHRLYYQYKCSVPAAQANRNLNLNLNSNSNQAQQQQQQQTNNSTNLKSALKQQQPDLANNNQNNVKQNATAESPISVFLTPDDEKNVNFQFISSLSNNNLDLSLRQVEDNLMNLSRLLSSFYLASLNSNSSVASNSLATSSSAGAVASAIASLGGVSGGINNSSSSSNVLALPSPNNATNSKLSNYVRKLVHHKQKSIDFMLSDANSSKIHVSKSNPNLINNELQQQISNMMLIPGQIAAAVGSEAASDHLSSSLNATRRDSSGNLLNTLNNNNNNNNNYYPNLPASSNNSSNAHLNNYNDDSKPPSFYHSAKTIYDQLILIYQQLLSQRAKLLERENQAKRSQRAESVVSTGGSSLQDSQLPFYDAIEYFTSDTESDDDSDQYSDVEDVDVNESSVFNNEAPQIANTTNNKSNKTSSMKTGAGASAIIVPEELRMQNMLTRRRKLPAPAPDSSQVSMWGILRKAIGKDLSKISLPVILNEPLSILQRLCEELEYSDLLDYANNLHDPYDRMVYVAAFVISGYASSYYRNGAKNFNPLLGETFELNRPDKGWRYVSEQVSHHPPISCTHCQSKSFEHEQLFHAKVKFWGKSMEVHPEGYSRVTLTKSNETYQWNKIVMYVYNVMGAGRRIEHYGQITIRCTNGTSCTITFPKASQSSQKNEFYGDVIYENVVKRKIFGQWHEAFLCGADSTAKTIWRMSAMPEEASLYYGFTRFAIELNEFTENQKEELPCTDSRFRPDQRNLEEGFVEKAEYEKQRIEDMQRKRRKDIEARGERHKPLWFDDQSSEQQPNEWSFNNQYWSKRENPGFKSLNSTLPKLW